ncbi:MAG: SCO family protein [Gemmatimonadales bacterium]
MATRRSLLASLLALTAGITALGVATDGFQAFTTETARRIDVRERPRALPDARLETADGHLVNLSHWQGRWVLVEFIYTRCPASCSKQGIEFAHLHDRLVGPIARGGVALLSISFDPTYDTPERLAGYQLRSGDRGGSWIAARPVGAASLAALKDAFGVIAIPDGQGGFVHNAAIAVVNPEGRLVAIVDWDMPQAAVALVTESDGP